MTKEVTLTVTALSTFLLDTTPIYGPPSFVVGSWVTVKATDGDITLERLVPLGDEPRIGSTYTTTITEAK